MLRRLFQIDPAERPKVALLFLYLMLVVGGAFVIGRSAGRALFLSALPPEAVPLKLVVSALAVVGATVVYTAVGARVPLGRLLVGSQLLMGGGLIGLWLLLKTPLGGTLPVLTALYGWLEIVAALISTQFWVLAGQLFDPRSARRSFGLIAAGGPIASIGAGALLAGVADRIATADLLLVTAGAAGLCALATAGLARRYADALAPQASGSRRPDPSEANASLVQTLQRTARSPLLGAIAAIMLLATAVTNMVDYQLDLALQVRYGGDGRAITQFLGVYNLWVGAGSFVVQVGLVAMVLERFGLRAALSALPLGFALGAAAVVASGGALVAVAAARANDMLFRFTLNDAAMNMLYLPIPAAARRRAKEALDGVVKPITVVVLAGLFALVRAAGWNDLVLWSLPIVMLVGLWLWLVTRAGSAYHVGLVESLRRRRLNFDGLQLDAADPSTRAVLLGALHGADDVLALAALQTIGEAPGSDWNGDVARLLENPSPELRIAAAQHLARSGEAERATEVARLLSAAEPAVRAAGVAAFDALGGESERIARLLDDPALDVRRAAIVGLMRRGDHGAAEVLRAMMGSAEPTDRAAGAAAIADIGQAGWEADLARLLDDPRVEVRRAAIGAVAAVGALELADVLVNALGSQATRGAAADALEALGGKVVARLVSRLDDRSGETAVRRVVPRVLARIGGPGASSALLACVDDADPGVRGAVYSAVAEVGAPDAASRAILAERVMPELRDAYALRALWADLGEARGELLDEAIDQRIDEALGRVFTLLGTLFPTAGLSDAWRAVRLSDNRKRANALEIVDDTLGRAWRLDFMPLLEASPERVAELARERFDAPRRAPAERLAELAELDSDADRWLRSCALSQIGRLGLADLHVPVESAILARDHLVHETALMAGQALLPAERVIELLGEARTR